MEQRKQFHVTPQKRDFFDRKVLTYGYSRTLSMGKIIPKSWKYVRLEVINKDLSTINLKITKLLGEEPLASNQKINKGDRQNP